MRTRITVTTAVSIGAALCVGTSVPAVALDSTTPTQTTTTSGSTITLAQLQSFVDSAVAARLARLDEISTNTAADPNLSDTQKAAIADWIAKQRAALTTLKSDVDGATTLDQARQALATDGASLGWFEWGDRDEHPSVPTTEANDTDTDAARAKDAADEKSKDREDHAREASKSDANEADDSTEQSAESDQQSADDQGDSHNTATSVRPAESSDQVRARTVEVRQHSDSTGDSSQPSEHHSDGGDRSRDGDHSRGDHGGGDHGGDHSGGDHSDSGH